MATATAAREAVGGTECSEVCHSHNGPGEKVLDGTRHQVQEDWTHASP